MKKGSNNKMVFNHEEQANFKVKLDTVTDVREFVNTACNCPYGTSVVLKRDDYTWVDGKSIMGLFSLNLSEPVIMAILSNESDNMIENIVHKFNKWRIKE